MATSSTAAAPKSFDVTVETMANLPWPDRERLNLQLSAVGLELASVKMKDAFWLDVQPYWFWVRATSIDT